MPLVDLVGPAFAKEMFFTGRQFDAREAERMGLVNRVVADDQLESTVEEMARTIAANAPLTVRCAKLVVGEALKDASRARRAGHRARGRGLLQQQRLPRGPGRLHGKAQAEVHRHLMRPDRARFDHTAPTRAAPRRR